MEGDGFITANTSLPARLMEKVSFDFCAPARAQNAFGYPDKGTNMNHRHLPIFPGKNPRLKSVSGQRVCFVHFLRLSVNYAREL
jgi:hypothetical protein